MCLCELHCHGEANVALSCLWFCEHNGLFGTSSVTTDPQYFNYCFSIQLLQMTNKCGRLQNSMRSETIVSYGDYSPSILDLFSVWLAKCSRSDNKVYLTIELSRFGCFVWVTKRACVTSETMPRSIRFLDDEFLRVDRKWQDLKETLHARPWMSQ